MLSSWAVTSGEYGTGATLSVDSHGWIEGEGVPLPPAALPQRPVVCNVCNEREGRGTKALASKTP